MREILGEFREEDGVKTMWRSLGRDNVAFLLGAVLHLLPSTVLVICAQRDFFVLF
jgi:hypothetical protein